MHSVLFNESCSPPSPVYALSLHDALPISRVRDEVLGSLAEVAPASSRTTFYSTLYGKRIDTAELNAEYWYDKDRKSTRPNSSHVEISYAVFCLNKKYAEVPQACFCGSV